ncbi:MAG: ATP-dependent Clp protease proteolytic subunit [Scytonema sp. PMC 1069.18]|nr:ATP-dependent Clp protease proteolytic subunit [Scytonema sp. PMC 1069.18]MEC4885875.1 ATP-dependent Clp protease proteolytic subunit [Scytonema sp. PMC 1070.18]
MSLPWYPNIPIGVQSSASEEFPFHLYSRLLAKRIIFLRGELTEEIANEIIAQFLLLDAEDSEADIHLYINSSGGSMRGAIAIYDTLQQIRSDVCTVCMGAAEMIGTILLSSGTKGKRYALPNARITIQQPSGNIEGLATEIELAAREILAQRETINNILADNTGRSKELIEYDTQRSFFLIAKEAKAYGLIDEIVTRSDLNEM